MIDSLDIMRAVADHIAKNMDEIKDIYIEYLPTEFTRPAVLIESVRQTVDEDNYDLVYLTEYMTVTVFAETDDYNNSSQLDLIKLEQKIMKSFRKGYVDVEKDKRHPKVKVSAGGRNADRTFIDLQLWYFDDKEREKEEHEDMGALHVKVEYRKD